MRSNIQNLTPQPNTLESSKQPNRQSNDSLNVKQIRPMPERSIMKLHQYNYDPLQPSSGKQEGNIKINAPTG